MAKYIAKTTMKNASGVRVLEGGEIELDGDLEAKFLGLGLLSPAPVEKKADVPAAKPVVAPNTVKASDAVKK